MQYGIHRPIYYELGEQRYRGHLRDLSPTRAFILTSVTHAERERVRLSWSGWSGAKLVRLQTWGTIERVEPSQTFQGARWPGFSLRLEPQDPEVRAFVQTITAALQADPGFEPADRL
jgi:hypothetical protein